MLKLNRSLLSHNVTSRRAFLALCALSALGASNLWAVDRDVSVYYYPWYNLPTNGHWQEGFLRSRTLPAATPALGLYNSQQRAAIEQHLDWSEEYGLDNWICSWWGRDSYEDQTIGRHLLPAFAGRRTKFCIYYESTSLKDFNQREEIVFDGEVVASLAKDIGYLAESYFSHPNYYKIDGRPVLHFYLSRCFAGQYEQGIAAAREAARNLGFDLYIIGDEIFWGRPDPDRIRLMDAITTYSMHGPKDFQGYPRDSDLFRHMSFKFNEYRTIARQYDVSVIPGIMPGYNNRGGTRPKTYAIPRQFKKGDEPTSTFREMIRWSERHIDPELNAVCITSFNEWHEDTQIEPTIIAPTTRDDDTGQRTLTSGYLYHGYGLKCLELVKKHYGDQSHRTETP